MRIDEPGQQHAAVSRDDFGVIADQPRHVLGRTDEEDLLTGHGDRFGPGHRGIAGPDPRAGHDE